MSSLQLLKLAIQITCQSMAVLAAEDETWWQQLRGCSEGFLFRGCYSDGATVVALLKWDSSSGRVGRVTASGILSWAEVIACIPENGTWKIGRKNFRIHVCRHNPCSANWPAAKYGNFPAPEAHGTVLHVNVQ